MSLAGNFREFLLPDLLDFYCLSRQTAAVLVTSVDGPAARTTGTFFIEGGEVVDARFEGREGKEAVRRAVSRLSQGEFHVELGTRSERRTVHEPWRSLLLREERPAGGSHAPSASAPPYVRMLGSDGPAVEAPVTPAPLHSRGTVVPPRTELPPVEATVPTSHTEPLPRIRSGFPLVPAHWALLFGGALLAGAALALAVIQLENGSGGVARPASIRRDNSRLPTVQQPPAGVTDSEVTFGMVAPLSGSSSELGRQMRVGLEAAFAAANADGGIYGRRVRLMAVDDGYDPVRTREVMRQLTEEHSIFGFVGGVSTLNANAELPNALLFGPAHEAASLRKGPLERTLFDYRANSLEETAAIVRYLVEVRRLRPDQIAVLAEEDTFGDAGYEGVVRALRSHLNGRTPLKVTYQRNTTDVGGAVARVLEHRDQIRAVVMVATYRAAARFIERVWAQRPKMIFASLSLVGSRALAEELVPLGPRFTGGVIVTQVVPLPTSHASAVLRYQDALARYAPGEKPDFASLEGYVIGNLLLEGLRRAGSTITTENMVRAFESIRSLDLGLGSTLAYGPLEHQGSHKVWGTVLDASGRFQPLDLE